MTKSARTATVAWLLAAMYYFYQYSLRSAPGVMMPQMSEAFGLGTLGVASLVGLFYYGYSPFSLVAGAAMDRLGARKVVPIGAAAVGIGALLFGLGNYGVASAGRFLQGAGGVFALVGAIYIASTNFPASRAATLIGATQMFGMSGGSAGQFVVGPLLQEGLAWDDFWIAMGVIGLLISIVLFVLLPNEEKSRQGQPALTGTLEALKVVMRNPQSILCGMIAGLLFIPTTIFDMIWGVRFMQEGLGFDYANAVLRSAMVPFGWIIGCPLLGFLSDRIGRRKPVMAGSAVVLLGCLAWALYGSADVLPPYLVGLLAGVASGAAMLPYTVIKEANPAQFSGMATGVINFINFTFSALLAPVFGWLLQDAAAGGALGRGHFQITFSPMLLGVGLAMLLIVALKETGPAAHRA